jgi:hypothetical protein
MADLGRYLGKKEHAEVDAEFRRVGMGSSFPDRCWKENAEARSP